MAVDTQYQAVHEKTVGKSIYEACQRKVRNHGYLAPDRIYFDDGAYVQTVTYVKDETSPDCRNFYLWNTHECSGCPFPKDTNYAERMRDMK